MKQTISNQFQNPRHVSDLAFYSTLRNYRTCCYRGNGIPIFLINDGWCRNIACLIITDCLFIFLFALNFLRSKQSIQKNSENKNLLFFLISIGIVIITNFIYFLTQFLNPGIKNLSTISPEQYIQNGKKYCQPCLGFRTQNMDHCFDCGVCVEGIDHHCGFFNKCIAGYQKYAFYFLMIAAFLSFCMILVSVSSNISL